MSTRPGSAPSARGVPGRPGDWRLADLCERWAELVGNAIADVSRPLLVDGSTLVVEADSVDARSLLETRAAFIVRALPRTIDGISITRLAVRMMVTSPGSAAPSHGVTHEGRAVAANGRQAGGEPHVATQTRR